MPSLGFLFAGIVRVIASLAVLVAIGTAIDRLLGLPPLPLPPIPLGGAVLIAFGGVVEALGVRALWKSGDGTPHPRSPPIRLVTEGPYRFSRNPLYVSRLSILSGFAVLFQSLGVVAVTILLIAALHFVIIPREEARLRARFGPAFNTYCGRVGRWLRLGR